MTARLDVRLKQWRTDAGLTQAELGHRVGVSRKTINTMENGVFLPSTALALELAHVFECNVEDLFSLRRLRDRDTSDVALAGPS